MSLFGKTFDIEHLIEKAMEHIDMEQITADVMADLKIMDLEMYFVVDKQPDCEDYDLIGMAYSEKSAKEMKADAEAYAPEVLKLNIAKLVPIAKEIGAVEVVS